jgi:hypothetical protein
MQTFVNFESHREMGNQDLAIACECERLIALFFDRQLPLAQLSEKLERLNKRYASINQQAEGFAVHDKDYRYALLDQRGKLQREPSQLMRQKNELSTTETSATP